MYLIGTLLFWFQGEGTAGWNVYFYSLEKALPIAGFVFLALTTHSKYVMRLSLYIASVCLFMFMFYIYCMFFGYETVYLVGAFLIYSFLITFALIKTT